ncbi:MAG: adenosine kinase [Pirellulaceae bacterium]
MDKEFDVFGVGNAIVDMLAFVPDSFIDEQGLDRGSMTLMDTVRQAGILQRLTDHKVELASGGSAANTMVAIAQSGGRGVYCGKVAHDTHGEFYRQDMEEAGIKFEVEMAPETADPTGTCVVLTTPDAERTMCTHLGISTSLHKSDLDVDRLAQCKYSYIEGYLWDAEGPRETCVEAFEQSKRLGVKTTFTVSDPFLVDRYHEQFRDMIPQYCDVLFCNADEAKQLCETDSLDECQKRLAKMCDLVFLTHSAKGCYVVAEGQATHVPGFQIVALDSVGAGDAFAGGVLYGLTHGMGNLQAARWGNYLASRVVEITGPRLHGSMSEKVDEIVLV